MQTNFSARLHNESGSGCHPESPSRKPFHCQSPQIARRAFKRNLYFFGQASSRSMKPWTSPNCPSLGLLQHPRNIALRGNHHPGSTTRAPESELIQSYRIGQDLSTDSYQRKILQLSGNPKAGRREEQRRFRRFSKLDLHSEFHNLIGGQPEIIRGALRITGEESK